MGGYVKHRQSPATAGTTQPCGRPVMTRTGYSSPRAAIYLTRGVPNRKGSFPAHFHLKPENMKSGSVSGFSMLGSQRTRTNG